MKHQLDDEARKYMLIGVIVASAVVLLWSVITFLSAGNTIFVTLIGALNNTSPFLTSFAFLGLAVACVAFLRSYRLVQTEMDGRREMES